MAGVSSASTVLALAASPGAWAAALHSALQPQGVQAERIHDLWTLALALCGVFTAAILAAFVIALRRSGRAGAATPPDPTPARQPEPALTRAVIAGVALSAAGLLVLLVASVRTDRALAELPLKDGVVIEVTANQWWWDVRYDDHDPSRIFSTANELHVPVGRPVLLKLRSNDVIHSFWVPSLHGKKDLIPGRTTTLAFRADRPGLYRGQCAEFCGYQHAHMALLVIAEPPDAYERWAQAQRSPASEPADDRTRRGRDVFLGASCPMCHAIQGTEARGRRAPDLTHVASRQTLAAGMLPNTADHLAGWIADPQLIKPGAKMPANALPSDELAALVAYLGSLR